MEGVCCNGEHFVVQSIPTDETAISHTTIWHSHSHYDPLTPTTPTPTPSTHTHTHTHTHTRTGGLCRAHMDIGLMVLQHGRKVGGGRGVNSRRGGHEQVLCMLDALPPPRMLDAPPPPRSSPMGAWGRDVGSGRAHEHAMCVLLSCG